MSDGRAEKKGESSGERLSLILVFQCNFRSLEEQEWSATELKNSLRSIEWDLEDLEDTVQVLTFYGKLF